MGDMVGVHGPHAEQVKKLIIEKLVIEGRDPKRVDQRLLQAAADFLSSFSNQPLTMQQFLGIIRTDPGGKQTWKRLQKSA